MSTWRKPLKVCVNIFISSLFSKLPISTKQPLHRSSFPSIALDIYSNKLSATWTYLRHLNLGLALASQWSWAFHLQDGKRHDDPVQCNAVINACEMLWLDIGWPDFDIQRFHFVYGVYGFRCHMCGVLVCKLCATCMLQHEKAEHVFLVREGQCIPDTASRYRSNHRLSWVPAAVFGHHQSCPTWHCLLKQTNLQ